MKNHGTLYKWSTGIMAGLLLGFGPKAGALDYRLPDLEGRMQSLNQFRGKWVIVNYWASWCSTCLKELPDLISLHRENRDKDIVVVGINFENIELDRLKAYVTRQSIPYPVLRSEPVPVTPLGHVPALPTTYIIDPEGKLVAGEVGIVTRRDIEDYITAQQTKPRVSAHGSE